METQELGVIKQRKPRAKKEKPPKLKYVKVNTPQLHDLRMLNFMDHCIKYKMVESKEDFCREVEYTTPNNLSGVKVGTQHFTVYHVGNCCRVFGADANYFFKQEYLQMFPAKQKTALADLQAAVQRIELEIGKG